MRETIKEGCVVSLSWKGGYFEGSMSGDKYLNGFGGATYEMSEVKIDSLGISSWDPGFHSTGVKV